MNVIHLQEKSKLYWQIRQIGAGGNGGYFFRNLLQMISMYMSVQDHHEEQMFDVLIADGDTVEKKNLQNQLFDGEDVSEYKTISLGDRYGGHYGVPVKTVTEFITTTDQLRRLYPKVDTYPQVLPVLVGMIDNDHSRQLFDSYFYSEEVQNLVWIDLGIEGMEEFEDPTKEQRKVMDQSGFEGQCVVGLKWAGEVILEPVTRVYRNMLENARTAFPGQSCGELLPREPG